MARMIRFVSRKGIVVRARCEREAERIAARVLAETRLARAASFATRDGSRGFVAHARGYAYATD